MFSERQKMDDFLLYVSLALLAVGNMVLYRFMNEKNLVFFNISVLFLILMFIVFKIFRLDTKFNKEGILYRFFPWHLKEKMIKWNDIESITFKNIKPFRDFGGYGIRFRYNTWAYIMKGDQAIEIKCKNQVNLILLGILNKEKVMNALRQNKHGHVILSEK
ncbi:MAG: hypothetical protein IPN10_15650 [Saprospiraceae bacterium]|nr:hypothetical protein [Saprospiraceae bacterium]